MRGDKRMMLGKRIASAIFSFALAFSMVPVGAVQAFADEVNVADVESPAAGEVDSVPAEEEPVVAEADDSAVDESEEVSAGQIADDDEAVVSEEPEVQEAQDESYDAVEADDIDGEEEEADDVDLDAQADEITAETVKDEIKALSADPTSYTAEDREMVEAILADFESLSAEDQAAVDAATGHSGTGQPLGRVLESALWAVWSFDPVDARTTLAPGVYDATTIPALSSEYSKGKSTSGRQRPWSVKNVTVDRDGNATATVTVESDSYSGLWMGGETYPKTNTSGNSEFANVPIDLNSTFYFAGISTSMPTPIAFSLTTTIDETVVAEPTELDVENNVEGLNIESAALSDDSLLLTMDGDEKFIAAYVGTAEEANESNDGYGFVEDTTTIAIPLNALAGAEEGITVSFYDDSSTEDNAWIETILTLDQDEFLLTIDEAPESSEAIDLAVTNNTGMFNVVAASAVRNDDGSATLTFALSGTGYRNLYKGTYEQAVANGDQTGNWIAGALNDDGKWEFQMEVAADELGTNIPVVAISNSYYQKYLNGQNSLERAFYPRQLELDLEAATLVTGDYEQTKELEVTNNVPMLKVSGAALDCVGGPNSNNYKADLVLTMGSTSYSEAFVGTYAEANEAGSGVALAEEGSSFTLPVKWVATFGMPETLVSLTDGEPFYLSLKSKKNGTWYERKVTLDEAAGTLVIDPSAADYSAVNEQKAAAEALDRTQYTEESLAAVDEAVAAVVEGKFESQQAEVDAMADAIAQAIAALEEASANGPVDLAITNNTGMFKAVTASAVRNDDGSATLTFALSGTGYHWLYKGTYEEALAANDAIAAGMAAGEGSGNLVMGALNDDGKWEFSVPVAAGESFVTVVAISDSYYQKYLSGQNPLERAYYPRQLELDLEAATLVTGDYDTTAEFALTSEVADFAAAPAVPVHIVGGPNSNNYKVEPTIEMTDGTYDSVTFPSVVSGAVSTATVQLVDGKFAISMLNAPNKAAFRDKTPLEFTFHVAEGAPYDEAGTDVVRTVTFDQVARTITVAGDPLTPASANLADGTYAAAGLSSTLGMPGIDAGKDLLDPQVVVSEGEATLVFATSTYRFDGIAFGTLDAIGEDATQDPAGTTPVIGSPIYAEALSGNVKEDVLGYVFAMPLSDEQLASVIADPQTQLPYLLKYIADPDDVIKNHDNDWHKASNQPYMTIGELSYLDDTTDLPEATADYSGVIAQIKAVPADLSPYTDESVQALQSQLDAVATNKKASEQAEVDAMAVAIAQAIEALELKPVASYEIATMANPSKGGTITATVDGQAVTEAAEGATVAVGVEPAAGYKVKEGTLSVVAEDGTPVEMNADGTFTMPAQPVAIGQEFEPMSFKITKDATSGGKVELRSSTMYPRTDDAVVFRTVPEAGKFTEKFNVTYTDPETGKKVTLTVANGGLARTAGTGAAGTVAEYSFTMPAAPVTINATFSDNTKTYKITKNMTGTGKAGSNLMLVGSDGKVAGQTADSVAPTMNPKAGQKVYFKSVPAKGAKLTKFNVTYTYTGLDGKKVNVKLYTGHGITSHGNGLYSFTMPCYPVTLTGEFTK